MAKAPAFQFYTRDWLASSKTRRMTLAERGLYVEMLAWQFEDGSLPDDPAQVAAMVGAPLEVVEEAWQKVRALFDVRPEGLVNTRLERARKEWKAFQKERSESGRRGAEKRHGKRTAARSLHTVDNSKARPLGPQYSAATQDRPSGSAIAEPKPSSASASALEVQDQNLNSARAHELRNLEIEEHGFAALSDIPSLSAFLGGLNDEVAKREALNSGDVSETLNDFFPPTQPGAGPNPAIRAWIGRIPEQTIANALRYFRTTTYRNGDGVERTWGELSEEHCKRVITAGLNAILRERG